jgi:hypothetical protein
MTEESEHYMDYPRVPTAYDLIGSRIGRYTSHLRPHWIQNLTHKINILQGLG